MFRIEITQPGTIIFILWRLSFYVKFVLTPGPFILNLCIENWELSWCQLYPQQQPCRLSWWQPVVPSVTPNLTSWQLTNYNVLNPYRCMNWMPADISLFTLWAAVHVSYTHSPACHRHPSHGRPCVLLPRSHGTLIHSQSQITLHYLAENHILVSPNSGLQGA